jgi:2-(1,2-epoxy-1,2-dihydrophenyl)acetyl-CoA isomerase
MSFDDAYRPVAALDVALDDVGVLRFRLDKPAKRNALDDDMVAALIGALDAAGRDERVRAIVFTGAGDHFCSGFDIVGRNAANEAKPRVGSIQRRLPSESHRLIPLICTVQVPVVCAAQGWTAGIGLHVAAAADFTIVADDAKLWEPFSQRGFTPDSGGTWLLPRLVGTVRARELLLLGRTLSGTEAAEWGLVHRSVPLDRLEAETEALVAQLASGPTVTLGLAKQLLLTGATASLSDQLRDEAMAMELSSRSEDFREGLKAFSEKRDPEFRGR